MVKHVKESESFRLGFSTVQERLYSVNTNFYGSEHPKKNAIKAIKVEILNYEEKLGGSIKDSIANYKMKVPSSKYIVSIIGDEEVGKSSLCRDLFNIKQGEDIK